MIDVLDRLALHWRKPRSEVIRIMIENGFEAFNVHIPTVEDLEKPKPAEAGSGQRAPGEGRE